MVRAENPGSERAASRGPRGSRIPAFLLLAVALLLALIATLAQTSWGVRFAARLALGAANPWPDSHLTLREARGGLFTGFTLVGLDLRGPRETPRAHVDTLALGYRWSEILGSPHHLRQVRISGVSAVTTRGRDGKFDLLAPFLMSSKPPRRKEPGFALAIDRVDLRGLAVEARLPGREPDSLVRLEAETARLHALRLNAPSTTLVLDTLAARAELRTPPALELRLVASGDLAEDRIRIATLESRGPRSRIDAAGSLPVPHSEHPSFEGWRFHARLAPLAGSELQRLLGFAWNPGDVLADLEVQGHGPALTVKGEATIRAGRADLDAEAIPSVAGPIRARAKFSAKEFDVGSVLGRAPGQLVFNGSLDGDLHGPDLRHVSGPLALAVDGSRVDSMTIDRGRIAARFDSGRAALAIEGAARGLELTGHGEVAPFEDPFDYDLSADVTIPPLPAARLARRDARPLLAGRLNAHLAGHGMTLPEAAATLVATFAPDASARPLIGAGRLEARLAKRTADAGLSLVVSDGSLDVAASATLGATIHYALARGRVRGIDLAALLGDSTASRLDARFRAEGSGFDPRLARCRVPLDSVSLVLGRHRIERGSALATLEGGRLELRAGANCDGAAVRLEGSLAPIAPRLRDARLDWSVQDLDVARVSGDSSLASALDAHGSVQASSADLLAAWRAVGGGRPAPDGTRTHATMTIEPSTWRDQRIESGRLELSSERRIASFSSELETSAGRAQLTGEARAFDSPPSVTVSQLAFSEVALSRLLGNPALATDLRGTLSARLSGHSVSDLSGDYRLALDGSTIRTVQLDRFRSSGSLDAGKLASEIEARSGLNRLSASLHGTPFARPARLEAQGQLLADALERLIDRKIPPTGARIDFSLALARSGAGLDSMSAEGRIAGRAHLGEARLDTIATLFRVDRGLVRVSQFHLDGNVTTMDGSGQWAIPFAARTDSTRLELHGTARNLTTLAAAVGARALSTGTAHFQVSAEGPAEATRFSGALAATRPHFNQIWADSVSLSFAGTARDTVITSLDARLGAHALVVWPFAPRDLESQLNWNGRTLACDTRAVASPERTQEIAFRLTPGESQSHLRLERQDLRYFNARYSLARPCEIAFGRALEIDHYVMLENGHPCLAVNGGIDSTGVVDLAVRLDSLALRPLIEPLGATALSGVVSGDGALTGSRAAPRISGSLRGWVATSGRRPATLEGRVRWEADSLESSFAIHQASGQSVAFDGRLPMVLDLAGGSPITTDESAASVALDAKQFDLSWFEPLFSKRDVRGLRGTLDGHMELKGQLDLPAVSGSLRLSGARIELPSLGTTFEKGTARVAFAGRTVRLEQASVQSGKGRFDATGRVDLLGKRRRAIEFDADWRRFTMMNTLLAKVESTGKLKVTGRPTAPQVGGDIQLDNSTIYAEGSDLSRKGTPVELSEADRRDLQERFGFGVGAEPSRTHSLADSIDAEVRIKIGKNVWVRRRSDPVVALEMEGDLRAIKRPGAKPQVIGKLGIRTGRSYLSFLGRQFEITRADVVMPGPVDSAEVDLEARYDGTSSSTGSGSNATVTATVSIDASGANVDLQSEPYMDRASLFNYLATGQTQGEMASGSAYGLAVGSVLGAVGGAAGRSLGFQVVQVTQDAYGGQTLSAGNYVDPRVYLGFRQPVVEGQRSNQTSQGGTYSTEFEVEVEVLKQLLFNVQGGGTQYRFLLRPRLGH